MRSQNPFEVLELTAGATHAEIKSAYRRLVRLYHPDNNPGFPDEAAAKLRELRDAQEQALAGWTPPPVAPAQAGWTAPRPAPASARRRGRGARGPQAGAQRPWTPPPPTRHDNPPRRMDPPTVPKKPKGPPPPEPKYIHVPPARPEAPLAAAGPTAEEVAAAAVRRARLVDDLVATGFVGHADELALDHAILDAFLPVIEEGERIRACARYRDLAAAGTPASLRHEAVLHHPLPPDAGDDALAALVRGRFLACTERRLLWTVSRLAPGDGGLAQERLDVHAEALGGVARSSLMQGGLGIGFDAGLAVRFGLPDEAAAGLAAAIEDGGGGAARR
ncbi:MAG: J domain-containing protein [Solirubrobacteraceae bacterium]|nr:J domain-containing protein [Solirubrobacteraceae bacterium]